MYYPLITLVIAAFCAILFLNIFFRLRVLKHYKYLVQNRVEFSVKDIFDAKAMDAEVLPKYPQHASHIKAFADNIKRSVYLASALILLISVLALILKKYY